MSSDRCRSITIELSRKHRLSDLHASCRMKKVTHRRTWRVVCTCKTVLELHNLLQCPQADAATHLPGGVRMALLKNCFNLFKRASCCLRKHKENVDERSDVEGAEHEVCLVGDSGEAGGDGPSKPKVEQPVRCRRQGDCLSANTHWEDLRRICPRNRPHGDSEAES